MKCCATERLMFIGYNQTKLRSEECVHLRDAVVNCGNATNVGRLTILPSSNTGSPRHMNEYAQNRIVYVVVSSPHQSPRCGVLRFSSAQSITIPLSVWLVSISPAH